MTLKTYIPRGRGGGKEDEKIRGGGLGRGKIKGRGLPMSSLGTYKNNLSDPEKKRGYRKIKKGGGGMFRQKITEGGGYATKKNPLGVQLKKCLLKGGSYIKWNSPFVLIVAVSSYHQQQPPPPSKKL